jgi:hypothetical protein
MEKETMRQFRKVMTREHGISLVWKKAKRGWLDNPCGSYAALTPFLYSAMDYYGVKHEVQ